MHFTRGNRRQRSRQMNIFNLLAIAFVVGTVIMVAGFVFLGYLQWREEGQEPAPVLPASKGGPGVSQAVATANDPGKKRNPA